MHFANLWSREKIYINDKYKKDYPTCVGARGFISKYRGELCNLWQISIETLEPLTRAWAQFSFYLIQSTNFFYYLFSPLRNHARLYISRVAKKQNKNKNTYRP